MKGDGDDTFRFSGRDSLSQFGVWIIVLGAGGLPVPFLVLDLWGKTVAIACAVVALLLVVGLRASIVITPHGVVITRWWFFVPYWSFKGRAIEDVWFGGDWGEAEDASGVVVQVDGREIHIGSRNSMHALHGALVPFSSKYVSRQARATKTDVASTEISQEFR